MAKYAGKDPRALHPYSASQRSSTLKGKKVKLWRDADPTGDKWLIAMARLCRDAGASIWLVEVALSAPHGWDIADDVPDCWRLDELLDNAVEFKTSDWYQKAMTGTRGNVLNNVSNALLALRSDENFDRRLTYNEFSGEELIDGIQSPITT